MSKPITIGDDTFQSNVLDASGPVLVDFWAPWCGPCRMIAPHLEKIAAEHDGQLTVAKINIDNNLESAQKYSVRSIPTLILFKDGKAVERVTGALPKKRILEKVTPHLN